ncbi:MAG: hypothetical protein ABEI32_15255 [Halothece sp.]
MLHHISIDAQDPFRVSKVLCELTGGQFFEFPISPGAYMVIFGDEYGSGIEVLPKDTIWFAGETESQTKPAESPMSLSSTHLALSASVSRETIEAIGLREGWLVRFCDRGLFQVIELWLENSFMLELLTAEMMANYLNFMKPEVYTDFLAEIAKTETVSPTLEKQQSN